jgi:hypothetical protein
MNILNKRFMNLRRGFFVMLTCLLVWFKNTFLYTIIYVFDGINALYQQFKMSVFYEKRATLCRTIQLYRTVFVKGFTYMLYRLITLY